MKYKYKERFVQIKFDGECHIGYVLQEVQDGYGSTCITVLLQNIAQTVYFDTSFGKPKILWEER
jgi:hypothetical protein